MKLSIHACFFNLMTDKKYCLKIIKEIEEKYE
jgi:hypothetical protein